MTRFLVLPCLVVLGFGVSACSSDSSPVPKDPDGTSDTTGVDSDDAANAPNAAMLCDMYIAYSEQCTGESIPSDERDECISESSELEPTCLASLVDLYTCGLDANACSEESLEIRCGSQWAEADGVCGGGTSGDDNDDGDGDDDATGGMSDGPDDTQNEDTPWLNPNCSEDCNGSLVGVTDGSCADYNSNLYESGTIICTDDCFADTSNCVERPAPQVPEFSLCSVAGYDCADGLECVTLNGFAYYCILPCLGDDDITTCGENKCVEFSIGSYCLESSAQRDNSCLENVQWCAEGEGDCQPTAYDADAGQPTDYRCKITCDMDAEESTCANGEVCMVDPIGFGSVQETNPDCDDDSVCDPGFECIEIGVGTKQCFKRNGLCGNPVGNCMMDISELESDTPVGDVQSWFQEAAQACLQDNGACTVAGTAGHAYCAEIIPAVEDASPAFSMCVDLGMGLCIAFCDGSEGELDCGAGFACERPAQPLLYLDVARDANDMYVSCSGLSDTSCGEIAIDEGDIPYSCSDLTIGFKCARALKQCVQNASMEP